jgi:serine/threonine protein kinase
VIGKHLNNYEVVSLLGEGGMGTVYLALHPIMGRKAAVKVLKPELARDESLVGRFFNEARAANAIRHPNIIDIIDVGMLPEENVPYMLMEFLEGESLSTRLEKSRLLPVEIAVEIAFQTASALAAAHSKGIVHRDLKPDNLFLVPDEMLATGERVKVLDFGIAKLRDDMRGSSMKTRTGAIMGTAAYMSPEQCQGLIEKIDHRTDIYALGIILYEMLCGAPPFISEGFGDIIIMHVMKEPEPPQNKNPSIPDGVAAAILCALAKDPNDRFQTMLEFQTALRSLAGQQHATPVFGAPSPVRTAILDVPIEDAAERAQMPFDRTMATPPPVMVTSRSRPPRPPSTPPSHISTLVDPTARVEPVAPPKQSTTFRNATGEMADTAVKIRGKRSAAVAVAGVVGLAAAGLVITLLVTRPSGKPASTETNATRPAPDPSPIPTPVPEPDPPQRPFEPPPPPPPSPPPTPAPRAAEPEQHETKNHGKKPGKGRKPAPETAPERPAPPPSEPAGSKKDTERW